MATADSDAVAVFWDEALLSYDLGDHPLDPVRLELTVELARSLGVLDRPNVTVCPPRLADDEALLRVHQPDYISAVKAASGDPFYVGAGLGTPDNPVFDDMHEASALVAGATLQAAELVWSGRARRAVNIAGGLHHAMPDRAAGFCVYNDPAVAIARLLELGAERIAYLDLDVHHGDGVQHMFYNDPRVLTISLHQNPLSLFPGTGFPDETGGPDAEGTAVNLALPPGTTDGQWLTAFHAVVPELLRAYRPELLFTQCGADAHRLDPLAELWLSVDGQRASYLAARALADELCGGRWVATGGGGYALIDVVPRAWTHLLAVATGQALEPSLATPVEWQQLVRERFGQAPPHRLTDEASVEHQPWQPSEAESDPVARAILATRRAVFPAHGLRP
ncbi:MAG: acetoin utilization protein AcuC [Micromonosporaceae bacterium]